MSYAPIPMVPGPVALHEDVIAVLGRDYGSGQVESDFLCLYDATSRGIGKLMGTKDDVVLMTGEGMLALWGALKSCLKPGDHVVSVGTGVFGDGIGEMAESFGCIVEKVSLPYDCSIRESDLAAVEEAIRSIPHVAGVEFISKDQMLDEYSQRLEGYTNLKEMFQNDNPLLANYVVRADDPANISSVAAALQNVDGVRAVNSPQAMSDLFVSLQKAVTYVCYGLVIVLAIVSVVVISNTIKITVFNRRKEIGIMKLVGATNGFIRFPFFVEGVTSGLISALIASAIVCGGYYAVYEWYGKNPTNLTAMFGGTLLPLQDLWYYVVLGFMLFGFVLCGIGTATSIRKHLQV